METKINQCARHEELLSQHTDTGVSRHWWQQNISLRWYWQLFSYILI